MFLYIYLHIVVKCLSNFLALKSQWGVFISNLAYAFFFSFSYLDASRLYVTISPKFVPKTLNESSNKKSDAIWNYNCRNYFIIISFDLLPLKLNEGQQKKHKFHCYNK